MTSSLREKASRPLALAALAVSLGVVAGPVAWRLYGEPVGTAMVTPGSTPGATPDATPGATGAGPAAQRPDIGGVLAANPFGAASPPETPSLPVGETDLGYTLLGVTLASPQKNSRAMIADASARSNSYGVGAQVATGVTVTEIHGDHVVLRVGDELQILSFPNAVPALTAPGDETGGADKAKSVAASGVAALNRLVPAQVGYYNADPEEASDADSVIARYRAAIRHNPMSVMVRLGIVATDRGYLVTETTSQGVLNAGFRPGDVIRTVNGKEVGNLQSDVELFDQIAAAGLAQVELFRGGEKIRMSFPLR